MCGNNNNKMSERPTSVHFPSLGNKISIFEQGTNNANKVQKRQKQQNNENEQKTKQNKNKSQSASTSPTSEIDKR